jgi:hypothetical protein
MPKRNILEWNMFTKTDKPTTFVQMAFFFCIVNALIILVAFQLSEHG